MATLPKEGILYKVMVTVFSLIAASIIGWGSWITVAAFDIEDLRMCATKNEVNIEKKADALQRQINTRMDKQEKAMDKQSEKLNDIMMILINMNNKNNNRTVDNPSGRQ